MPGRIEVNELLLHDVRGTMYDALMARGPMTLQELATTCRCSTSTILWHAQKLRSAGILVRDAAAGSRTFRAVTSDQARMADAMRTLQSEPARLLFEQAIRSPGTVAEMDECKGDMATVLDVALGLAAAGLIEVHDWDGRPRMYPTRMGERLARLNRPRRGPAP